MSDTPKTSSNLLNLMSREEKAIVVAAALGVLFCLTPWWSISTPMVSNSKNALDFGFGGILAFLGSLATGGLVLAVRAGILEVKPSLAVRLPMFAACAALLGTLIFQLRGTGDGISGDAAKMMASMGVTAGRTVWSWCAVVSTAAATWLSFQRWKNSVAPPPPDAAA